MPELTCPHCGNPVYDEEALLCLYCGNSLKRKIGFMGKMKNSLPKFLLVAVIGLIIFSFIALIMMFCAFADTVILTDGEEVKGLVVDEHADRIVVSTFEGEKALNRTRIEHIRYEDEETHLLKLAGSALDTKNYEQAIYYYKKVLKLDPDSTIAKDGARMAIGKQLSSGAEIAKEEIDLMIALEEGSDAFEKEAIEHEKNIRTLLGLELAMDKKKAPCFVEAVYPRSVSYDHGVQKGDIIDSIWNTSVKYMPYEGVVREMAGPEFSVVKLSVERQVVFNKKELPGLNIALHKEGYFIKDVSGLLRSRENYIMPGDWILEVNSAATRYMPEKELKNMITDTDGTVSFLIKRDIYIRREKRR